MPFDGMANKPDLCRRIPISAEGHEVCDYQLGEQLMRSRTCPSELAGWPRDRDRDGDAHS